MPLAQTAYLRFTRLLLAGGLVVLLGVGAGVAWLVAETRGYAQPVSETQALRTELADALSLFQDAETGQRGYLLTGRDLYLEPYRRAVAELPRVLPQLAEQAARNGALPANVAALDAPARDKLAELGETLDLAFAGDREGALRLVQTDRGIRAMDALREAILRLDRGAAIRLTRRAHDLDRSTLALTVGVGGALLLLLGLGLAAMLLALRRTRDLDAARAELAEANAGLEGRVADRTADLAALNEEVQRFAYIVSHDLRAPLVNILGFTAETEASLASLRATVERLDATDPTLVDAEARAAVQADIPESLRFIRSSSERMDRLINAILRFSREGRRELRPELLNMDGVASTLADGLRAQLDATGAELTVVPGMPRITADRLAVEQMLGNLLDNAVKYLDPSRPGRISVSGGRMGPMAWFDVADNGRGVDARDQARIFDLFRRAGRQDRPGEGIGLAHVRALARRLGGTVRLTSTPGEGSTFRLLLPLHPPATDAMPHREAIA